MKKIIFVVGCIFVGTTVMMISFSPDVLSLLIIGLMTVTVGLGFLFGMLPTALYGDALRTARNTIDRTLDVSTETPWLAVKQVENLFQQKTLNRLFAEYKSKIEQQDSEEFVACDIEEVINEDALALRSWQNIVSQIPGTLTALGLLGTFLGLLTGISNIGFSSVDAAVSSIELLLNGISLAFFTSIAGVIFSILFNIVNKFLWNLTMRELGLFQEYFHMHVMPTVEELNRKKQFENAKQILERLDRIPKEQGYSLSNTNAQYMYDAGYEQRIMPEIREGFKKGEFIFHIQPRCDLNTNAIVGGEALMRWQHGEMGLVSPATFIPIVEKNGFIAKLDQYIWEEVCRTIRRWVDSGVRPVPISINISKTDIMAIDVADLFARLIAKYRIPPRYLELEIAKNAYLECGAAVYDTEEALRQNGFRVIVDGFDGEVMTFSHLKDAKADAFKLDLRFVEKQKGFELSAVFEQARKHNVPLLAEGIEHAEQLTVLKRCGCAEGQGYYLYRPMPLDEFEKLTKQMS